MGEEEKKPEEPKPAPEEPPKPAVDAPKEQPPPPPPQEIVLKVYMHCEGCARKVRRCLKGFDGVEDVMTDCRTSKVVVKGEKADPVKVLERVQRKSHRQVELISPIPPPPAPEEAKKPEEKEPPKPELMKEEPPVITVVLGVYMHCEACAQELKKRILRMKGVESVEPDMKSSQVTVKGVLDAEKLTDYVHKRTGKHATVVKVEPEAKKEEEKKEEKKPEEAEKEGKKEEGGEKEKKEEGGGEAAAKTEAAPAVEGEETKVVELKKNEMQMQYYYNPNDYYYYNYEQQQAPQQRYMQEYQLEYPPPQMFSDENPNAACSVM
ncbi:heavy metal-associated isoprenylated plant protein 7-like [Salvia splendens]|uniref:heavy metal-associated isoprenylated plant protein 7-like n=1 Tax=Salvia splendens TaxID=180675 RepID=UPI001C2515A4|nr:heavy metal-associated isoprenylated plant protein 7-like [Salvia splendens]